MVENGRKHLKKSKIQIIAIVCGVLILSLFLTYIFFTSNGNVPTGAGLGKSDWLTFVGGYLSFAGSVVLGAVAVYQNRIINMQSQNENEELKRANKEAVETNNRLLSLLEARNYPIVSLCRVSRPSISQFPIWHGVCQLPKCLAVCLSKNYESSPHACVQIMLTLKNEGRYPITSLSVDAQACGLEDIIPCVVPQIDKSITIDPGSELFVIIGFETVQPYSQMTLSCLANKPDDRFIIKIEFSNIFGYRVRGVATVSNLADNNDNSFLYQLQPVIERSNTEEN